MTCQASCAAVSQCFSQPYASEGTLRKETLTHTFVYLASSEGTEAWPITDNYSISVTHLQVPSGGKPNKAVRDERRDTRDKWIEVPFILYITELG